MKSEYTREELIELCKDSVVSYTNWGDRDSYSAQLGIKDIYEGLMSGVNFNVSVENDTIWINFEKPTKEQLSEMCNYNLDIDSIEDYREYNDYDCEMVDGSGISWYSEYRGSYMPTRERLDSVDGGDWY